MGNNLCHKTAYCINAEYFTCIFNNRRGFLHTRNYILRNKKGKILSLNMALVHHCRKCFSLLCNLTRILEYITKSDCLRAVVFHCSSVCKPIINPIFFGSMSIVEANLKNKKDSLSKVGGNYDFRTN